MKPTKLIAAGIAALLSSSGFAAVRPSVANVAYQPVALPMAGARIGATTSARRSNVAGVSTALIVAGVAAAGVGIAAAAGAFDNGNGHSSSP